MSNISTVTINLNQIKLNQAKTVIPLFLEKYHPEPKSLVFDYVSLINGRNTTLIVAFTENKNLRNIYHPILLFKQLKKDGKYTFIYDKVILTVEIKNKLFKHSSEGLITIETLKLLENTTGKIFCSKENTKLVQKYYYKKLYRLERYYNPLCGKIFKPLNHKKWFQLALSFIFIFLGLIWKIDYDKTIIEYKKFIAEQKVILQQQSKLESAKIYLETVKSQMNPDAYTVLSKLFINDLDYKVTYLNYNNNKMNLNIKGNNSVEILSKLNLATDLTFTLLSSKKENIHETMVFQGVLNE